MGLDVRRGGPDPSHLAGHRGREPGVIPWGDLLLLLGVILVSASIVVGAVKYAEYRYPVVPPEEWLDEEDED